MFPLVLSALFVGSFLLFIFAAIYRPVPPLA
jgi:hypothetical protein